MDWVARLSPAQLEAATRLDAPVCILAGAGSGKTRVITHRIAWLVLEKRVAPERILAVTFTNKAAGEMKERIARLVPGLGHKAQVGTFHGLAARFLRRWGRAVGLPPSFVIYDDDDWHRLLQRIVVNDLNLDKDTTKGIGALIDSWQSEGLDAKDVPKGHDFLFDEALKAYQISRERLDQMGAVDFGGLLLKLRDLLKSEVGPFVKGTVKHVLVDEYQDVNALQAEIVLAFGREADSVAVVGDDDQAIYGWRGASASNLRRFLNAMPGATLVKLEENYRSTGAILEAANGIIARNQVRLGKVLRTTQERGRSVRLLRARDDLEEARRIISDVSEHARAGTSLDEIAVLYRANALSRPFEDELRRANLPYRVVGGVRFYDRKEVKDVLATVRCAVNHASDVDTLRFLAAVPRGIGDTTQKKLEIVARKRGLSLLLAMNDAAALDEADIPERAQKKCLAVSESILTLGARIRRQTRETQTSLFDSSAAVGAKEAIALAVEVSGVADRLQAEGSIEAEGRLENLGELLSAASGWAEQARTEGEADDIIGFLESASLLSSADERRDGRGQVTLMSLHAAKGLEFDVVYLAGLEEHGFPHARSLAEGAGPEALEEERRLAYVGITRARRRLVISYADWRMVQGQRKRRTPSRFLHEIPRDCLDGDIPSRSIDRLDMWRQRTIGGGHEPALLGGSRVVYDDDAVLPRARLVMTDADFEPALTDDVDDDGGRPAREQPAPGAAAEGDAAGDRLRPSARVWRRPDAAPEGRDDDVPRLGGAATAHPADGDVPGDLASGHRVWHRLFGAGTVVGMRGHGRGAAALVRFDLERQPRLIIARHLRADATEVPE